MTIESFVPFIIEETHHNVYVAFALECQRCPHCGVVMAPNNAMNFPLYNRYNLDAQVKRMHIKKAGLSSPKHDDRVLCEDCSKTEVKFTCAHCEQEQGMDQVRTKIGADPAEYLCLTCFKSITAERWADISEDIRQRHMWDYE